MYNPDPIKVLKSKKLVTLRFGTYLLKEV